MMQLADTVYRLDWPRWHDYSLSMVIGRKAFINIAVILISEKDNLVSDFPYIRRLRFANA